MQAAVVTTYGAAPKYGSFADPLAEQGEVLVRMRAAALSNLTKGRAEGRHYSSAKTLPIVAGVDGVGQTDDGRRVYVALPRTPFGTMAELCPIEARALVDIPDELDDVLAAALANPGMSSWAALHDRAKFVAGECVLVNGATGVSGGLAVHIAKHLGARRVIATGRDVSALQKLRESGADAVISLQGSEDVVRAAFRREFEDGVDVVLDYLWGRPAELLLLSLPEPGSPREGARLRFVQIGSVAGQAVPLPASVLRSTGLELVGSGLGSVSNERLLAGIGDLFQIAKPAGLAVEFTTRSIREVEAAWNSDTGGSRLVFTL